MSPLRIILPTQWSVLAGGDRLGGRSATATPIDRVVDVLQALSSTLESDAQQDEDVHGSMVQECDTALQDKMFAIKKGNTDIESLQTDIKEQTARSQDLSIASNKAAKDLASNREALAEATQIRNQEAKDFKDTETDTNQAIVSLEAAVGAINSHAAAAFPQLAAQPIGMDQGAAALIEVRHKSFRRKGARLDGDDFAVNADSSEDDERDLNAFMISTGIGEGNEDAATADHETEQFMQDHTLTTKAPTTTVAADGWSAVDVAKVRQALGVAQAFAQETGRQGYQLTYNPQSTEILAVLRQMLEDMNKDLQEAAQIEQKCTAQFDKLSSSKSNEILALVSVQQQSQSGLADANTLLSNAKRDIRIQRDLLDSNERGLEGLKDKCGGDLEAYKHRQTSRAREAEAVAQAISLLSSDEAKAAFEKTWSSSSSAPAAPASFLQLGGHTVKDYQRRKASGVLRAASQKTGNMFLMVLATRALLSPFDDVHKVIDKLVAHISQQRADAEKHRDYCKFQMHDTEDQTTVAHDRKADLEGKIGSNDEELSQLRKDIAEANEAMNTTEAQIQTAEEARQQQRADNQRQLRAEQTTMQVLQKVISALSVYFDFLQTDVEHSAAPTTAAQATTYRKSEAGQNLVGLLQKVVNEAQDMVMAFENSESEAEDAYKTLVADSEASNGKLRREVVGKTVQAARLRKRNLYAKSDLEAVEEAIERLDEFGGKVEAECTKVIETYDDRRKSMGEEIEALKQAQMILTIATDDPFSS